MSPGGPGTSEVKTQYWLRALSIIFGLICVLLSAVVLAYPGLDILTLVLILAGAMLVVGLGRIIVGIFAENIPIRLRTIDGGAGLLGIAITITAMFFYPQFITQTLIQLLSIALLVYGIISAAIGGFARTLPSLLRGLFVAVGLLSIVLPVIAFASTSLDFLSLVRILSIGYLSIGIADIILGITGIKRIRPVGKK
ncbi:MAG TPA: hypothetical protein VMT42_01365 [candidate division Zixibacteria bacterium]|nr:hypothetical protein [candidate division Zixibacteria bacterium]